MMDLKNHTERLYSSLNSLNFRAELLHEIVTQNYYFFAHFTAQKLNVR